MFKIDSDLVNHVSKCRCCFKSLKSQRKANKITKEIEKQFYDLVQIELISSELYSSTICDVCKKELESAAETKEKFSRNQKRLLKFVEEQNSLEQDCDDDSENIHEDTEEPTVDQFDIDNVKWDEVVVKVEPVDFNEFFIKEAGLFEFFELPTAVKNKDPPARKIKTASSPSESSSGYKHCYVCDKSVSTTSFLKHLKSHRDGENKFHCRFCNYKHAHCSYFKSHMITHSTTRPTFTCGECQKVFFCITAKENHEKSHQIDVCKPHECDKCDQKFKAVFGLFKHNKDDHKIEQIPCKICGRLLKAGSFIPHISAHEERSKKICFSCDQCDYKSYLKRSIKEHMIKHTSNRKIKIVSNEKYPCSYCSKVFNSFGSRSVHEKAKHLNLEYVCKCGKVFTSYPQLYSHKRKYHSGLRLKCQKCVKVFLTKICLQTHFDRFHAVKSPCDICGKMVGPGIALKSHKRSAHAEQVKCEFKGCGKILSHKGSYNSHVKAFHAPQGSHKCPTCDAEFNNDMRLKIHISRQHKTEKKPCQVPGCSHSTFRQSYLIMHYKNHKNISGAEKEKLIKKLKSTNNRSF